jgi:hypothetical protein
LQIPLFWLNNEDCHQRMLAVDAHNRLNAGRARAGFIGVHHLGLCGHDPVGGAGLASGTQWLAKSAYEAAATPLTYVSERS